jgi:branched-chain amino acid transport system permease protein
MGLVYSIWIKRNGRGFRQRIQIQSINIVLRKRILFMGFPFEMYVIQATHGLVFGMLIFLVASGLTIVFGMMGVLNFAHAAFYMLGAYIAYSVTVYLGNFWLSLLISPLIVGILGVLIECSLLRRTYKVGPAAQLLVTFGLLFIFSELVRIIWGGSSLSVPSPELFAGGISFMKTTYPKYRLFILGFSFLMLLGIALMLMRTRIGIIIRAAVSDREMVEVLGINVPIVFMGVFGGGAAIAALAGVIASPFLTLYLGMGTDVLMDCFSVVIIGGFGSLFGAFIASLMIGELQSLGVLWIPRLALVFQFLLMAVVLIVRPTGLFGEKE